MTCTAQQILFGRGRKKKDEVDVSCESCET